MDRVVASLPDSVAELCLVRFGLVARRWMAVPWIHSTSQATTRWSNQPGAKEAGLLHSDMFTAGWKHVCILQYWRDFESVHAWSHMPPHSEWWRGINARIRSRQDVGVYHETFLVPRERYESIFIQCPRIGVSAFGNLAPPTGRATTSRDRLGRRP